MSEQGEQDPSETGTSGGFVASETAQTQVASTTISPMTHHGRPVSWVAISMVIVGFLVGAVGMMVGSHGPVWPVFWTGAGIAILGLLVSVATNTFADWY